MRQRIIIIGAVVVIIIIALFLVWHFVFSGSGASPATTNNGQTGTLPNVGVQTGTGNATGAGTTTVGTFPSGNLSGQQNGTGTAVAFGILGNEPVADYFIDAQQNMLAVEPDGKISKTTAGQSAFLSSSPVDNFIAGSFSYNGAKALVSFGDPAAPQTSVFDVATKAWMPLPVGLISPAWSPSDYRVAYLTSNASSVTETIATLDVSKASNKPVVLLTLHASDLSVKWLDATRLLIADKPSAYVPSSLWVYDLSKKTLSAVISELPGLETAWGIPAGKSGTPVGLVFSAGNTATGGNLHLTDLSGNAINGLSFLTLPSKCLFANQTSTTANSTSTASYLGIFCAVPNPQSNFSGSRLPDSYDQMGLFTQDSFVLVNLASGQVSTIFSNSPTAIDAMDLKIFNNALFFVNRYDSKLYAISLASTLQSGE